jgi:nucleoid-associated protein YgaU
MYYNSNKNNNDYYTSYKEDILKVESYQKEGNIQKLLKWVATILSMILFILGGIYLYEYFNPSLENYTKFSTQQKLEPIVIRENELPKSIQASEVKPSSLELENFKKEDIPSNISAKDVALIVQIIMSQMNKKEIPLEKQLETVEKEVFAAQTLKESNHYNKVVISENKKEHRQKNDNEELLKLSNSMNAILSESSSKHKSTYLKSINKEISERKNAMRVIIVKQGDSLSKLAKKAYGSYDDYTKIFAANPEIIKNPDQIYVGQRLRIPSHKRI